MSRQEDFDKFAIKTAETISHQWGTEGLTYADLVDAGNKCAEHGYQHAVDMIAKHLLCIELSNFFPTLDEDEEIAKGRKKLIQYIRKAMEE